MMLPTPVRKMKKLSVLLTLIACVSFNFYVINDLVLSKSCSGKNVTVIRKRSEKVLAAGDGYKSIVRRYNRLDDLILEDYFGCDEVMSLMDDARQVVVENEKGNRGVWFVSVTIGGRNIEAVMKQANRDSESRPNIYKYNTAVREIEILKKLQGNPGIPKLFGSCIENSKVSYVVEKIEGNVLCNDNGTTDHCADADDLMELVRKSENPPLSALKLAYSTSKIFKVLENLHYLFEDISGVNLMLNSQFQLFIVDVDSFVFYNSTRLFSELSCSTNYDCYGPMGKHWSAGSLNAKIFRGCQDLHGICEEKRCRGFDASLHPCGISNWYLCKLSRFLESMPKIAMKYREMCACISNPDPNKRCSFSDTLKTTDRLLREYFHHK